MEERRAEKENGSLPEEAQGQTNSNARRLVVVSVRSTAGVIETPLTKKGLLPPGT